jgi:hypothetical protein
LLQPLESGYFLGQFQILYANAEFIRNPPDGHLFNLLEEDIKAFEYLEESMDINYEKIRLSGKERLMECMTQGVVGISKWLPPYDTGERMN